ncbi:MAG: DUF2254 domain-containing protein [Microbacterium sp.]|uniref:DUF2254 domain-containing protein n=1 Tax=Microbacterium sp. TaxID=51671 RepID=UPI0039E50BFA
MRFMRFFSAGRRQESLSGSLWFLPLVTTLAALALGFVLGQVNEPPDAFLAPVLFHGDGEEARRMLITVATATIGVFAMVVGLTLVALQLASNRYSPRLVRVILRDRPTQLVLGMFIATFAYNAAGLYTVGLSGDENVYPRLAVTVGLALLFICIAALVYYVDRVAHLIQIHTILRTVGSRAERAITAGAPGVGGSAGAPAPPSAQPLLSAVPVAAQESGYVQRLDVVALVRAATAENVVIKLVPGIGGHIVAGNALAWIWRPNDQPASASVGRLEVALGQAVTIGGARSNHRDVALGAIEMVDIALLSMHIYDYHTVEQSTAQLTVLLCQLAAEPLGDEHIADASGSLRLIVPARRFEDYLELACGEIRRKGASEPVVLRALVRLLRTVGSRTLPERVYAVREQLDLIKQAAERSISEGHDVDLVLRDIKAAKRSLKHPELDTERVA